jgi:acetyl esterase
MSDPVHPYYRAILDAYAASERRPYHQGSAPEARELLRSSLAAAPKQQNLPAVDAITDEVASVRDGGRPVSIRRYRPLTRSAGACILMHAGGWVIGDLNSNDALARRLCADASCEVINVDYRLAPEHPHPAALDDVFSVLQWYASMSDAPVVLAGESSGGNLAAACAIRARESGGLRVAGQFLAYPVTDHDFQTRSYREMGSRNYLLTTADMQWFWDQYCPPGVDRASPMISPLRVVDATGLAPALIFLATLDPLRDEGLAYARHLSMAGVPVTMREDPGMLHGYLSSAGAVPLAEDAVRQASLWMRQRLQQAEGSI